MAPGGAGQCRFSWIQVRFRSFSGFLDFGFLDPGILDLGFLDFGAGILDFTSLSSRGAPSGGSKF